MSEEKIIAQLFEGNAFSDLHHDQIEEIIARYPYFALPRFWLAKKNIQQPSAFDQSSLVRARLFAFNPFLFYQYLYPSSTDTPTDQTISTSTPPPVAISSSSPTTVTAEMPDANPTEQHLETQTARSSSAGEWPAETHTASEPLSSPWIAPLYTRDYFAYAGISLAQEEFDQKKPTSDQVKSFTEWLRSTRRPQYSNDPDACEEENTTESSFQVITEAMANIRLQQGQPDKAIEILEHLRLLNPEKNDYFAKRIEEIQNQITRS
ncbi:MAG: hypothetical protein K6T34_08005 [Thermoflavifilum sp.]|nr:hypothetical protein [Thermoflavifilum sp.]